MLLKDSLAERSKAVAQGAISVRAWVRTPQLQIRELQREPLRCAVVCGDNTQARILHKVTDTCYELTRALHAAQGQFGRAV